MKIQQVKISISCFMLAARTKTVFGATGPVEDVVSEKRAFSYKSVFSWPEVFFTVFCSGFEKNYLDIKLPKV